MFAKINRSLQLLLWSFVVIGVVITSLGVRQVDLWWHLSEGLAILQHGSLPTQPTAAFGLPARPYVDEYSLYEIALALIYRLGGFAALGLAFAAIYLLIFFIPLAATRGKSLLSTLLLGLAVIFMINRLEQRPELVGVLGLILLLELLRRCRGEISPSFVLKLCLLLSVWSNVHSSFVIGLLALFLWLLERTFSAQRRLPLRQAGVIATAALLAVMINPYGWHRIAFTFAQERDIGSNVLSQEMWPIWSQPDAAMILLVIGAVLLLACFTDRKRPPAWLAAFACVMFLMSLHSLRHISFLAAAMLTLYAERQTNELPAPPLQSPWRGAIACLFLGACCIVTLIFDFTTLSGEIRGIASARVWGRANQGFAPAMVDLLQPPQTGACNVLCGYAEGSYLTFAGQGRLRPLLDSGLGRFADSTKRLYFFIERDPLAFDAAVSHLPVDYVLVTRPVAGWTLAMTHRPGWRFVACNAGGIIFQRDSQAHSLDNTARQQIETTRDYVASRGDFIWAFSCSVLVDDIPTSLGLLDHSAVKDWTEIFFNHARRWIETAPLPDLTSFAATHGTWNNLLVRELVLMRTNPRDSLADSSNGQLGKSLRILDLLGHGDLDAAQAGFAKLPQPEASTFYYEIRDRLRQQAGQPPIRGSAREDWQDRSRSGPAFWQAISVLSQPPSALPAR